MKASRQSDQMEMANRLSQYDVNARNSEKEAKAALSQDLIEQMRQKNLKKNLERQQSLQQEHYLTKHVNDLDSLERERQKQFNYKYKQEALEDLKLKEKKRQHEAVRNAHEK